MQNLPTGLKEDTRKLNYIVKKAVIAAFEKNKGNFSATRFELGISRSTLYRHLKKYGLYEKSFNRR